MNDAVDGSGFEALRSWLGETGVAPSDAKVRHLVGDVSRRRYLRLEQERPMVLALYPPDLRGAYERFVRTTRLLEQADVRVPSILAQDVDCRFMALEDVGDRSLYSEPVGAVETEDLYGETIAILPCIRSIDFEQVSRLNPPLDRALFLREVDQTRELFSQPALVGRTDLAERFDEAIDAVLDLLDSEDPVVCHRDLMARNVQVTASGIVVLDHQDLRLGPAGYDLASLLHDSLRLSERQRRQLEEQVIETTEPAIPEFERSYWLCVVQRCTKIIGTFCSFALRGGRRHLPLIPAAVESLCEGLERADLWDGAIDELAPSLLEYWSANLDDFGRDRGAIFGG